MTGERYHAADDGSLVRSTGGAAARGALLIAVAIIIGLVLLAFALDDPATVVEAAPADSVTTDDGTTDGADGTDATASTNDSTDASAADDGTAGQEAVDPGDVDTSATDSGEPAVIDPEPDATATESGDARAPAEVNVLVANGTGERGVAGTVSDKLKRRGYIANAANAPSTGTAVIYYRDGYAADAAEVATILGAVPTVIQPIPASGTVAVAANAVDDGRLAAANVVVIIGADGLIPTT